jgi:vacuolar-type H+-ATPase subunit I/STV1
VYDNKVDSLILVRVEVERELATTQLEIENYRGISPNLDTMHNEANGRIQEQERRIRSLIAKEKDGKKLSKKLKAEIAELKRLKDEYLERIDVLITENTQLKSQNEQLNTTVNSLNEEKKNLQGKVAAASVLKAEYVKVNSYKKKNSGKYVESSLAKRTNKLEACFTVLDNKITEPGEKMIYMVIKEPTGKILQGNSKAAFTNAAGEEVNATASYKINFTGEKQDVCLNYDNDERLLVSGNYVIEIYMENTLVSSSNYSLR